MPGIALSFDDGPDPVWTPRLLDLLGEAGARATFFPITERVAAAPHLLERMLADGHAIGLHCREHVRHTDRDPGWLRRDTAAALATLAAAGADPSLWRPPWGARARWTATVAREHGLDLVGWDVDTHDWRGDSVEEMYAATRTELVDGAVVLAHDGIGPGARRRTSAETVAYVDRVVGHARTRGLELVPMRVRAPA